MRQLRGRGFADPDTRRIGRELAKSPVLLFVEERETGGLIGNFVIPMNGEIEDIVVHVAECKPGQLIIGIDGEGGKDISECDIKQGLNDITGGIKLSKGNVLSFGLVGEVGAKFLGVSLSFTFKGDR